MKKQAEQREGYKTTYRVSVIVHEVQINNEDSDIQNYSDILEDLELGGGFIDNGEEACELAYEVYQQFKQTWKFVLPKEDK
jgi:hypothetical protein